MEKISTLITQHLQESNAQSQKESDENSNSVEMPKEFSTYHLDQLWKKMTKIYGHKWTSSYGDTDDGTWLSALQRIPIEKVRHGLELYLTRPNPWPPSLPEFLQMCLDMPDIETVTNRVLSGRPTDTVSATISKQIGSWDLQNKTERELRTRIHSMYESAYSETISEMMVLETKKISVRKHKGEL